MIELDRRTLLAAGATLLAGCTARARPTDGAALRIDADRIYLPVTVNGMATEALLDSAAEATFLDRAFADRLKLGNGRTVTARGSGKGTAQAELVGGVELTVAGVGLRPEAVAILDLGDISRRLAKRRIDIVLGRELFDARRLGIDIAAARLTVLPRDKVPPGRRLPLTERRGIELLPVTIEGHVALAEFDLGNGGQMLVGKAFAARHRLLDGRATSLIGGGGIGGETMRTAFTLRRVDIAGTGFDAVPANIDANDNAADANIGVALLRRFHIVTDYAQRSIWLDPL